MGGISDKSLVDCGPYHRSVLGACYMVFMQPLVAFVQLGDSGRDDSCSSGGSVIRVPIDAGSEAESGYSSDGSVIRVPIDREAASDTESDYSSNGSVVRVSIREGSGHGEVGEEGSDAGSPSATPVGTPVGSPLRSGLRQGGLVRHTSVRFAPAVEDASNAKNANLQTAAKYFAGRGGPGLGGLVSQARGANGVGAAASSNGPGKALQTMDNNPEVHIELLYYINCCTKRSSVMHYTGPDRFRCMAERDPRACGTRLTTLPCLPACLRSPPRSSLQFQANALSGELSRLDVAFANDLAKLRNTYDTKKARLQAELRACLARQSNESVK